MMNKRGGTGESILMMYRVFLVMIIAFAVFFVVALYYDFYIDSLDGEAVVLNRKVANCLIDKGFELEDIGDYRYEILDYCSIVDGGENRLYVRVSIGDQIYDGGDSGVRAISQMSGIKGVYRPGVFTRVYDVYSVLEDKILEMEVGAYVKSEEK